VHQGSFEDITQGMPLCSNGSTYQIVGPYREIYIRHGKSQLPDSTTEIQFSVEKG
jgi:hypothetical protein